MPRWILYTLITVLLWGLWGVVCKMVSEDLPAWQLQVMSLIGILPVIVALVGMTKGQHTPADRRMLYYSFGAGLLGCVGNLAYFQALASGGKAAAVTPLTSLYPITTILLAMLFLKERPTIPQTIGIGLSLVAIWLFNVANETGLFSTWLIYSLLPIVCWGVGGFMQKLATSHVSGEQCALAFLLGFMPMVLLAVFQEGHWESVSLDTWMWAVLSGFLFALGNLTVILAYGSGGKAVIVTPLAGLYMLVTIPLAVSLLGETITFREGWGIAAAVLAVISLCYESSPTAKVIEA